MQDILRHMKDTFVEEMTNETDARGLLKMEFQRRLSTRPQYSLRAFAKALKVSPATLSLVLSGKLKVSKKLIQKMVVAFSLPSEVTQKLLNGSSELEIHEDQKDIQKLTWDIFTVFSEWYHFAILSLLELKESNLDPKWISKKLGISGAEATTAVERLKDLGLIAQTHGRWKQTGGQLRVPQHLSTAASRKFQKQLLLKAIDSLEHDQPETRDITSMTFAMDPELIGVASDEITAFRRSISRKLESKKKPKAVYNLTIQLYPVTKTES